MTFVFWNLNAEVFTQPTTECFKKVRNLLCIDFTSSNVPIN